MTTEIRKYGNRNWAIYLLGGPEHEEIIAVTLYKKGAASVKALADALIATRGV